MKAIIIDDEKKGREILKSLIENYCDDVEVLAQASNAQEGYELILEHKPDLIFLDVEMPNGDGFSLLERFNEINFQIVFTTAFDDYAIKAIKFHALDYLLKPIDIDELKSAVANVQKQLRTNDQTNGNRYNGIIQFRKPENACKLALPIKDGIVYLPLSEIIRVESDGAYSIFYTDCGKKHLSSKNLGEYEEILPEFGFYRIHRSHMVNMKKVRKFLRNDGNFVEMEDGSLVEISRRKKDEFLQLMNEIG
ncbi:MAG TPA: LytTR family DNA-binding domain-containing protein [Chitinophagales bacterium]|nr:LytTR family DNA-binding domain-containing protein [Chitinophagales bacterium]